MHHEHLTFPADERERLEWDQHARRLREALARVTPWPGADQERGIIICGGGERYLPGVWVVLNVLRRLGCALPVEVWHPANGARGQHLAL